MNILKRYKTGIPKKYVYIVALLFCVAVMIQVSSAEQNLGVGLFLRRMVLFGAIYIFWAVCIDYINALVQPFHKKKSIFFQIIERFSSSFILVLLNLGVTNILYYVILISFAGMTVSEAYVDFQPYILKSIIVRFIDVIIIGLILKIIAAYQSLQQQKLKVISLENQLHISQLETLRNQLDPHFLFNTLHTLNTLIGYDDKKARSMVIKVTNLLRKILDKRAKQIITFEEEIDYFKNYLEIEEERFHDRLEVTMNVDDATRKIMVPTLMLQPLVENAFKHGIAQLEDKGTIELNAFLKDDIFVISLSNTIAADEVLNTTVSMNIGLQNLESRLQQVYGKNYTLQTEKKTNHFVVTIKINQT